MSNQDVSIRARKVVADHLGVEQEKVVDGASFLDDLDADSLDTIELVMIFEEEFGIEISDDDCEAMQTFGNAVEIITRTLDRKGA